MVKTYRVKEVKAIQFTGDNTNEILEFCDGLAREKNGVVYVFADSGKLILDKGDFVCATGIGFDVRSELNMNTYYVEVK